MKYNLITAIVRCLFDVYCNDKDYSIYNIIQYVYTYSIYCAVATSLFWPGVFFWWWLAGHNSMSYRTVL